jgi:glycine dehydrogenase
VPDETATINGDIGFRGFRARHIGPDPAAQTRMLDLLGYPSVDALIDAAVPEQIRSADRMALPAARS